MMQEENLGDIRIDIRFRGEVFGVAPVVDIRWVLIYTDVVDLHGRRESEVVEIYWTEVEGHAEVGDDVHRFLGYRAAANLDAGIGTHARLLESPHELVVSYPANVLWYR